MRPPFFLPAIAAALLTGAAPELRAEFTCDPESPEMAWWRDSRETLDQRLSWWREARFGCFMHWGVYAQLAGVWEGKPVGGYAEHIQRMRKIDQETYRREAVEKFNPAKFDADAWVRTIKAAGMGYLIITAKHHDGFAMWDSKVSDYNIVKATPFKRDPMRELKEACARHGVRFGFYYSHAFDWGDPDGPGNDWEWKNPGGDLHLFGGRNWWDAHPELIPRIRANYVEKKSIPQLRELLTNYDPAIMWFDTPHKLPPADNLRILRVTRETKPDVVINGRLFGWGGRNYGDYTNTCDKPTEIRPQSGDWEAIPTTNESYGYHREDHSHKAPAHFIRLLVKAVARGGNLLMNLGPRGDGTLDPKDVKILEGIGAWMKVNGQSVRGAGRTPLPVQAWGQSTLKGGTLFLHVFDWPSDGTLMVGGLKSDPQSAVLLTAGGEKTLDFKRAGADDLRIKVPPSSPFPAAGVIALRFDEPPATAKTRLLAASGPVNRLHVFDGRIEGRGLKFGSGSARNNHVGNWTKPSQSVSWDCRLAAPAEFEVSVVYEADKKVGGTYAVEIGTRRFTGKVGGNKGKPVGLGRVSLPAGPVPVSVKAVEITGEELMRLRGVRLVPVH